MEDQLDTIKEEHEKVCKMLNFVLDFMTGYEVRTSILRHVGGLKEWLEKREAEKKQAFMIEQTRI